MPRDGSNPMKNGGTFYSPKPLTICTLVYVPMLEGYWAESIDVLKICIDSIRANTKEPFDLVVFDNGSCPQVRNLLMEMQANGQIDMLMLSSRNLGKLGALNVLFPACPGEFIAYCDADVFFHPGWDEACLQILKGFPNVGMVHANPAACRWDTYSSATLNWAETTEEVVFDTTTVAENIIGDWAESVGMAPDKLSRTMRDLGHKRITLGTLRAFIGSAHYQFLARKDTLCGVLPFKADCAVGAESVFDRTLNDQGYLRLTTVDRCVEHIGNKVGRFRRGVGKIEARPQRRREPLPAKLLRKLLHIKPLKFTALAMYNLIFRLYRP